MSTREGGSLVESDGNDSEASDNVVFFGDKIGNRDGNLRIMYNNVNGLKVNEFLKSKAIEKYEIRNKKALSGAKSVDKIPGVLATIRKWDTNIICLSESQCAWENYNVRDSVNKELRTIDRYAGLIGSSSCVACADAYKPGGTLTVYDGNWASRINKGIDPHKLGRWSYVTILGRNNSFLTIITGYRCVNKQTEKTAGFTTTYMQQERILRQRGITSSPQTCFINHMELFIMEKVREGHDILLNLDANEQWEDENSGIREMALRLNLFDIAKERHPNGVPGTFVRSNSNRRIDLMLGSENVLKATMAYGMAIEGLEYLGDHRAQFIDINVKELLQLNVNDVGSPVSRRLRSSDPKCIKNYCDIVHKNFTNHNVYERLEKLWKLISNQSIMTAEQIKTYNAIDRDVFRLCRNAENTLKNHSYTKYVWSPVLDEAVTEVQHWKSRKKHKNNDTKTDELVHKGIRNGISDDKMYNTSQIDEALKQAYSSLHSIQKKDWEKRQEYLNNLAEKYANENNISKEQAIRELMSHEELRELFRTIRIKMKGARSPQMSEVWIKTDGGDKLIIEKSHEVEDHLLERNCTQLRQAANTPFADGEFSGNIGWDGTGDMANRMVEGLPIPEMQHKHEVIQKYIEGMAMSDPSIKDTVDCDITIEEYKKFWISKRESTATSPYGLHIGHYKSVVGETHQDILEVQYRLMMIPFKYAMIPTRWSKTVQILLEKDTGRPWTNRLRIIELFDSQVNAGLQMIFGKKMVANAIKHGAIHPSAYGSVPKRTAQDAAMEKTMSLDMIRVTKRNAAIFDCDAKGCYDRIVAALQTVANRRLGVKRKIAIFFARFWRSCEHHVKTRHGISKEYYVSTFAEILYGIGQGNGAGPAFWLATLIIMFVVLDQLSDGMTFDSPNGKLTHKSTGMGYVDDVTLGTTAKFNPKVNNNNIKDYSEQEEDEVHKEITKIGQNWEMMLHTNGGLLELKKCYWVFIAWKWVRGIAKMKSVQETDVELALIQTEDNVPVQIPRKEVGDAPRILGMHIAADGKWTREVGRWKSEAAMFAKKVKDARFSRSCGNKVYSVLWMSKLRYISAVVCFTKDESEKINKKVVAQCLPAAGYNRNFPRKVVYGPSRYGGMAWETCRSVQIVEKIKFFTTHMRRKDKLGNLLRILIDTVQLQSGINEPILTTKIKWQKWVERTWLHYLKDGLDEIDGALHTDCKSVGTPRQFDRSLMEIFHTWDIGEYEMNALNRCRVYLQVVNVSDITNFEGTMIMGESIDVIRSRESTLHWSKQIRPVKAERNIWKKHILRLCYGNELILSLGQWTSKTHQIWQFMRNKNGSYMYKYSGGVQYQMYTLGNNIYSNIGTIVLGKKRGFPIECTTIGIGYRAKDSILNYNQARITRQIFHTQDNAINKTMGHIKCHNLRLLKERWRLGDSWLIGTDGGLKHNIGTTGVTLHNTTIDKELCYSMCAESCGLNHLHSTREEIKAIVAAEAMIRECNKHCGTSHQTIDFICDNKSALGKIRYKNDKQQEVNPLGIEAELLLELSHIRNENDNIVRKFHWVKSHKDDDSEYVLSDYDKINQRADALATQSRVDATEELLEIYPKQIYSNAMTTLTIKGNVVSKDLKNTITMALYGQQLLDRLINKNGWTNGTVKDIDWDAHESELEKCKGLYKTSIYKLIHKWQPTNKVVQRNEKRALHTANCTECGEVDDQLHYIKCNSEYFEDARKYAWKKFRTVIKKYKRNETMIRIMWIGVKRWVYDELEEDIPRGDEVNDEQFEALKLAYQHQGDIGWSNFIMGRISKHWSKYYELRVKEDEEKNGKVMAFARDLVRATWKFTLSVWVSHNEKVHGKNNKYSSRNVQGIQQCIREIYDNFKHRVSTEDEWLFREEARIRCDQSVPQMIGWLESVLICLVDMQDAIEVVTKSQRLLCRMSITSIFE